MLASVLLTKALLEERWMTSKHPAYTSYLVHRRRFIPYLL
jgi:protein-S-isoprenylcysteine O-methyltransferase Ste14